MKSHEVFRHPSVEQIPMKKTKTSMMGPHAQSKKLRFRATFPPPSPSRIWGNTTPIIITKTRAMRTMLVTRKALSLETMEYGLSPFSKPLRLK